MQQVDKDGDGKISQELDLLLTGVHMFDHARQDRDVEDE